MLALDASAAVELLLDTARGRRVASHVIGPDLVCPELLDVEVASALARLERAGSVTRQEADTLAARLASLPVHRVGHGPLLGGAWLLRDSVRVADAFYVACAQLLDAALLTCDARLARATVPGLSLIVVA